VVVLNTVLSAAALARDYSLIQRLVVFTQTNGLTGLIPSVGNSGHAGVLIAIWYPSTRGCVHFKLSLGLLTTACIVCLARSHD
jgi:hypothetical protein